MPPGAPGSRRSRPERAAFLPCRDEANLAKVVSLQPVRTEADPQTKRGKVKKPVLIQVPVFLPVSAPLLHFPPNMHISLIGDSKLSPGVSVRVKGVCLTCPGSIPASPAPLTLISNKQQLTEDGWTWKKRKKTLQQFHRQK